MPTTGVFLSKQVLDKLTAAAREEIQREIFGGRDESDSPERSLRQLLGRTEPAELTQQQAEEFVARLQPPTIKYLKVFLKWSRGPILPDLLEATGYDHHRQLTGITSGLTKRIRTVLKDDLAEIIVKVWDSAEPFHSRNAENARYRMADQTVNSLRAVLKEGEDSSD